MLKVLLTIKVIGCVCEPLARVPANAQALYAWAGAPARSLS